MQLRGGSFASVALALGVLLVGCTVQLAGDMAIDWGETHQSIVGFGGAMGWIHPHPDQREEVFDLMRGYNAGLCIFDMPDFEVPLEVTADFAYVRFHGSSAMYGSCYSDDELEQWAGRIASLPGDLKAAYIYFNNDAEAFAVDNSRTLAEKLEERSG